MASHAATAGKAPRSPDPRQWTKISVASRRCGMSSENANSSPRRTISPVRDGSGAVLGSAHLHGQTQRQVMEALDRSQAQREPGVGHIGLDAKTRDRLQDSVCDARTPAPAAATGRLSACRGEDVLRAGDVAKCAQQPSDHQVRGAGGRYGVARVAAIATLSAPRGSPASARSAATHIASSGIGGDRPHLGDQLIELGQRSVGAALIQTRAHALELSPPTAGNPASSGDSLESVAFGKVVTCLGCNLGKEED